MKIPKNYILCNELAQTGGIHIANFSNFVKLINERGITDTVLSYGNCNFINAKSLYIPNNFLKLIHDTNYTDLSDKILATYITKDFECTEKDLLKLKQFNPVMVKIAGKRFIQFNTEFMNILDNYIMTNINANDYKECLINGTIDDGVKLSKDNYLVWYK